MTVGRSRKHDAPFSPITAAGAARYLIILAGLSAFLALPGAGTVPAHEFNPQGWEPPSLYGALRYAEEMIDFDPDVPGAETRLEKFTTPDGGRVFRYSHRDRVFSYMMDHDQLPPMDFEIVDKDGSGGFEIRQSPYDLYPLPRWTFIGIAPGDRRAGKAVADISAQRPTREQMVAALSRQPGPVSAEGQRVKGMGMEPGPGEMSLSIPFARGASDLTPDAEAMLHELGSAMISDRLKYHRFALEGHTDGSSKAEQNTALARKRAEAVKDFLVKNYSVDASRLEVTAKGTGKPLPGTNPADERNRRVQIVNIGTT